MNRASRKKKPEHYRKLVKDKQDENLAVFLEWKSQQKCCLCPEDRYQCLDLHHLDPNEKEGHIADMVRGWSWKGLQKELAKCVVVCRNCHALIHAELVSIIAGSDGGLWAHNPRWEKDRYLRPQPQFPGSTPGVIQKSPFVS